jgi:hypothetical protein
MAEQLDEKILNLYPIDYPFETLVARIDAKPPKLKLDPEFQRKYKWDNDGWGRASKFIESCLMRIPLPSCYFAEDDDGRHMVIDGVQRLTTIKRFMNDEFPLESMSIFKDLEGKRFSELGSFQSELESTTIRCIVLRKENPKRLIREIFSRLNQGAVKLLDQEIRHAIYPGSLDQLLVELGEHPQIKRFGLAEGGDTQKDGREPEEQVLRFFAFVNDPSLDSYKVNLKDFLDDYMEANSNIDADSVVSHKRLFDTAIGNCELVFGDDIFTNPTAERQRKGLVHYDLLMPTVGVLDSAVVVDHAEKIKAAYNKLCSGDIFRRSLSGGLQNKSSIIRRRNSWAELLEEALSGS